MDTPRIIAEFDAHSTNEMPGLVVREDHGAVHVWWRGMYAAIRETADDFIVSCNLSDELAPQVVPAEFDVIDSRKKGKYEYDEIRTTTRLMFTLRDNHKQRHLRRFHRHPLFGRLMADAENSPEEIHHWSGHASLPFFGPQEVRFQLSAPLSGPTADQERWYREFLGRQQELRQMVEPLLYAYYKRFRDEFGDEIEEIADLAALAHHLRPELLRIGGWRYDEWGSPDEAWPFTYETSSVTCKWECSWDCEHGVTAELKNWQFVEVGMG